MNDTNVQPGADPSRIYRLEVEVRGEWKGVHVENQSHSNGARLLRCNGPGNRAKLVRSTQVTDGFHLLLEVGDAWKGVHVQNQSSDDSVNLIRHDGDGNVFKLVRNDNGTYYLMVQAHLNYNDWKGVHVQNGWPDDNMALIRYRDIGHAFRFILVEQPVVGVPRAELDKAREELEKKIAELARALAEQERINAEQARKIADLEALAKKLEEATRTPPPPETIKPDDLQDPAPSEAAEPEADEGGDGELSGEEIWARVRSAWPGFEFMWEDGSSEAAIAQAEARLGVKLPKRVRKLMRVCSGASFPAPSKSRFAAEVCLVGVDSWKPCSDQMLDGTGLENGDARDYVLVGEDVNMVDYGHYIALRVSTGEAVAIEMVTGAVTPLGPFDQWLLERRLGGELASPGKAYTAFMNETGEEPVFIAEHHRDYMRFASLDITDRVVRWGRIEPAFIEAVRRLPRD